MIQETVIQSSLTEKDMNEYLEQIHKQSICATGCFYDISMKQN